MKEDSYNGVKSTRVQVCTACGAEAPHKLSFHHLPARKGESKKRNHLVYWVTICQACNELVLWGDNDWKGLVGFHTNELLPLFPINSDFDDSFIPDRIVNDYKEALKIKRLSPNAFSVLARRALESICDDKKVKTANLAKRLELLVQQENFPDSVKGLAKSIRVVGNIGAHSGDDVSIEQADVIDDFFKFIVEFVYVVPNRLKQFEESFEKSGM
jgi:hypothetical protein